MVLSRSQTNIFTILWCINVRFHSIGYSLGEFGLVCARRAEAKGEKKNESYIKNVNSILNLRELMG